MRDLLLIIICSSIAIADILHVPDNYPTIQQGIDASVDGDTVLVQPGTFFENIEFDGHNITMGSLFIITGDEDIIEQTIIDGSTGGWPNQSVVEFNSGENSSARLTGFTLTGGAGHYFDGSRGGGVYIWNAHPSLDHLIIRDNTSLDCGLICGQCGGMVIKADSTMSMSYILVANNQSHSDAGIGIVPYSADVHMTNMTVVNNNNIALDEQHVPYPYGNGFGGIVNLTNCVFYNNSAHDIHINNLLTVEYSDIRQGTDGIGLGGNGVLNWLDGNIDAEPLFVDPENDNYSLQPDSPCIDAGNPDLDGDGFSWEDDPDDQDPDGTRLDVGAFYFDQSDCEWTGDFNFDGQIDILDVVELLNLILENDDPPNYEEICIGDADGDSMLSVNDIPVNGFICDGFSEYIPGLPPVEFDLWALDDTLPLDTLNLTGFSVAMTNPHQIEGIQMDLVFPEDSMPVIDSLNTFTDPFGLVTSQTVIGNRIRVIIFGFTSSGIQEQEDLQLFDLFNDGAFTPGLHLITADRIFANGICHRPYDVVGDTLMVVIPQEPQVILSISEFNVNLDYVTFMMENTEPVAGIQLAISGFTIGDAIGQMESSVMNEGMFISGTESFLLITNLGMSTWIDPGTAPLVSFEIESVTDSLACILDPIASNWTGGPLTVETGPCIRTDLCGEAGDVEPDLSLDILDIVVLVGCVMGVNEGDACDCGDVTEDGEVDILDIVLLVNIIVG